MTRVAHLVFGAGLAVMAAASIWAPEQPELLVTGACNVAPCGTLEDPQRWRAAWVIWVVGAAVTLGATTLLVRRRPLTGWQRTALTVATVICAPVTAALGGVASLFTSVHGFATVMWTFAALPLAAVLAGMGQSLLARQTSDSRPTTPREAGPRSPTCTGPRSPT